MDKYGVTHEKLTSEQAVEIIMFHFNRRYKNDGASTSSILDTAEKIKEVRKSENPADHISKWEFSEWSRSRN